MIVERVQIIHNPRSIKMRCVSFYFVLIIVAIITDKPRLGERKVPKAHIIYIV